MSELPTLPEDLAAAMIELRNPTKDKRADVGQYGYTYAGLDQVLDTVREPLARHRLSLLQDVTMVDGRVDVLTILLHTSGDRLTFGPLSGPTGSNYQALGSAITYLRRYAVLAALGIAAEDDDGQSAPKGKVKPVDDPIALVDVGSRKGQAAKDWSTSPATDDQRQFLGRLVRDAGFPDTRTFLDSPEARKILDGRPSSPLVKGHASTLIDALTEWQRDAIEATQAAQMEAGEYGGPDD